LATPLIFAAIGGLLCERSGVFNIALEGCIINGALGAAYGAFVFGDPVFGLMIGMICGAFTGVLLAVLGVSLGINQIVAGISINMFSLGMTAFIARLLLRTSEGAVPMLPGFQSIPIPFLSDIPIIGSVLFDQDILVYMLYATIFISWWFLFKTPWGLAVRAVGQFPKAVDTAGMSVEKIRYLVVIFGCALASVGGAYIILSQVFIFTEAMSAGKGFIALAALILGRWNPVGAMLACLLFGFCEALQLRLQFATPEVPYQLFSMLPYLASILALVFFVTTRAPAASGKKYYR
jgi:simple sugar transport system permease protein